MHDFPPHLTFTYFILKFIVFGRNDEFLHLTATFIKYIIKNNYKIISVGRLHCMKVVESVSKLELE